MRYNPLVTVIVSTYKRKFFLKKTILSILSQTYKDLEVIVVNDEDQDSLQDFISSFNDARLRLLEIPHSGRPAVPRNIGIAHASGELIAFCDDDDIFLPTKIEDQVKVFEENPGIKLCYTNFLLIDEQDNIMEPIKPQLLKKSPVDFENQLLKNDITFSTIMICRSVLKKKLNFDERPILRASEDYLFVTGIVHSHPVFFILKPLIQYRVHKNGISYFSSKNKLLKYYIRILICMFDFLIEKKISFVKFIYLILFHFRHVLKQMLFPYQSVINDFCRKICIEKKF